MIRNARFTSAPLMAAALLAACAPHAVFEEPFTVPVDSLFSDVQNLVMTPLTPNGDFTIPGDAAAKLEGFLETQLRESGFNVIPAFEYIGIWQHIADESGGFFDTHTGERDERLYEAATARLRQELRDRFDADAVLHSELWDGAVPFRDGLARWDGTSQAVFGAYGLSGVVRALSLVVFIEDMEGREVYTNGVGFATIEAWHNNDWLPLALDGVIGDSRLAANAASRVFAPIRSARAVDSSQVRQPSG